MKEVRNDQSIEDLLKQSEALLSGHFILSSGLHSDRYVQCAKFFQYPEFAEVAARKLKRFFENDKVDVVIGGAFGGIVIAMELAQVLKARGIFCERVEGVFQLRRGFEIREGEKVVVAEDVITTGKSIREVIDLVKSCGGEVVAVASLIDRNQPEPEAIPVRVEWLHTVRARSWPADALPDHLKDVPAVKPGSRGQK